MKKILVVLVVLVCAGALAIWTGIVPLNRLMTRGDGPVILITADTLCVPDAITQEIARRLQAKAGLRRDIGSDPLKGHGYTVGFRPT